MQYYFGTWELKGTMEYQKIRHLQAKHIDLHVHTCYSQMNSLIRPKELLEHVISEGGCTVGITDISCVQAFPELEQCALETGVKVIYGLESALVTADCSSAGAVTHPSFVTLLAQNRTGLQNLYRVVSRSYTMYYHGRPLIPKTFLSEHRDGLLIGSPGSRGEVFQAIASGVDEAQILELADFYDYLALVPVCEAIPQMSRQRAESVYREYVRMAKLKGKLFPAVSDARFSNPEDEITRRKWKSRSSRRGSLPAG